MKGSSAKSGFTLLEMLVASLLLGMLVSILTMVFNSSSIAWRTGKAGVAQLSRLRRQLSYSQYQADNLLPCIRVNNGQRSKESGYVVSPWRTDGTGGLRKRAVTRAEGNSLGFALPNFNDLKSDDKSSYNQVIPWHAIPGLGSLKLGSARSYTVGVLSYGPDGKRDTEDDITTWPDKVE